MKREGINAHGEWNVVGAIFNAFVLGFVIPGGSAFAIATMTAFLVLNVCLWLFISQLARLARSSP